MARKKESVGNDFEYFFSLFDIANGCSEPMSNDTPAKSMPKKAKKEQIIEDSESYLRKGERLLTLAKEKYNDIIKDLEITSFEESLYSLDLKKMDLESAVVKLVRTILKKAESEEDALLKEMLSLIPYKVSLTFPKEEYSHRTGLRRRLNSEPYCRLVVEIGGRYTPVIAYGLKNHANPQSYANKLYIDGIGEADIATVLAKLLMVSIAQTSGNVLEDGIATAGKGIWFALSSTGIIPPWSSKSLSDISPELISPSARDKLMSAPFDFHWLIPKEHTSVFSLWHKDLFDALHIQYEFTESKERDIREFVTADIKGGIYSEGKNEPPCIYTYSGFQALIRFFPNAVKEAYALDYVPLFTLLTESEKYPGHFWPVMHHSNDLFYVMYKTFRKNYAVVNSKVETLKHLKSFGKNENGYAKSYMTKKNIPVSTLNAMKSSLFNDYFGYVEYDEDVDLGKVEEITSQFVAFKERYLPDIDLSDNQIRFRRLGNHKALGLYYPMIKCLCVDITSPSSLIHELGHLIDYCFGNLSAKSEFLDLISLYGKELEKAMSEDETFRNIMLGTGKYNLAYFKTPTEIFARCFEIYAVRVWEVDNSLTPLLKGPQYPSSDEFFTEVKEYFDVVLPLLVTSDNEEITNKAACS